MSLEAPRLKASADITVEGLVQGVGYRHYARQKAQAYGITGYVMNLRDGKVRVRAEGPRNGMEEYIRELEKGPPLARVTNLTVTWWPFTGRYRDFGIRFSEFD
jgi:acylphosphatase